MKNINHLKGLFVMISLQTKEGRQIPQIGFFDTEFMFPALLENDRIWMTITPNEIETMKEPVDGAFGHVLTFGLGLGYYACMVSEKENVESVTVVDMNEDVIRLFKKYNKVPIWFLPIG